MSVYEGRRCRVDGLTVASEFLTLVQPIFFYILGHPTSVIYKSYVLSASAGCVIIKSE